MIGLSASTLVEAKQYRISAFRKVSAIIGIPLLVIHLSPFSFPFFVIIALFLLALLATILLICMFLLAIDVQFLSVTLLLFHPSPWREKEKRVLSTPVRHFSFTKEINGLFFLAPIEDGFSFRISQTLSSTITRLTSLGTTST